MRFSTSLIFSLLLGFVYGQNNLHIFTGSLDQALEMAQQNDKNIFFITKSLRCNNFFRFRDTLDYNKEACDFINNEFIVFIYDFDNADKSEKKRLKKYYHS